MAADLDLDFESGVWPTFNGWAGAIWTGGGWVSPSTMDMVGRPSPVYHGDDTNENGHSVAARYALWGTKGMRFKADPTDVLYNSGGQTRVLIAETSNAATNITVGDDNYHSIWYWFDGTKSINGELFWELHDRYPLPGTDDGLPSSVAPISINVQESAFISQADWDASPLHGSSRPTGRGSFYWMLRLCYGDGTPGGTKNGYSIHGWPFAVYQAGVVTKFKVRVKVAEDSTGVLAVWIDTTSGAGAPAFNVNPDGPLSTGAYTGITTKFRSGSSDNTYPAFHNGLLYNSLGIYRNPPGSQQVVESGGIRRRSSSAAADAAFSASITGPPVNTSLPTIAGTAQAGQVLTAGNGTWSGAPTSFAYEWIRCDAAGNNPVVIGAAGRAQTYTVQNADVGSTLKVQVTATNASGSASAVSVFTATVTAAGGGSGPPVLDNFGATKVSGQTTISLVLNIGASANFVEIAVGDAFLPAISSAKIGTQDFVALGGDPNNDNDAATSVLYMKSPPTGTQTITVTFTSGRTASLFAASWIGVDLTNPYGASVTGHSYSSSPSLVPASTVNDVAVMYLTARHSVAVGVAASGGDTLQASAATTASPFIVGGGLTKAGAAGTTTLAGTISPAPAFGWSAVAHAVKGSAAPAAPVNTVTPAITGTAATGNVLSCSTGTWNNSPTAYTYQWQRDTQGDGNFANIASATTNTYLLQSADLNCQVKCVVVASNPTNSNPTPSNVVGLIALGILDNANRADESPLSQGGNWSGPVQSGTQQVKLLSLRFAATLATTSQSYRADSGLSGADCDFWEQITTLPASGGGMSVLGRIQNPGNASTAAAYFGGYTTGTGYRIFKMTAGGTFAQIGTTLVRTHVANEYLRFVIQGTNLTLYYGVDNGDGTFTWTAAVTTTDSTIAGAGRFGMELTDGTVRGCNYNGKIIAVPSNTVAPAVTGTATLNQVLTTDNGTWNNAPTSYSYQWQRAGVNIGGATGQTYTLVQADVGSAVRCVVTATNATGSAAANSNATAAVAGLAPVSVTVPLVTGQAQQGQNLTTSNGGWSNTPTGYAYQWKSNGVNVGANQNSYTLVLGDVGATITCTVTASNATGSASADSGGVGPVSGLVAQRQNVMMMGLG